MITEENKQIVESIWTSFIEAGNSDDLSIIEQSVFFIFQNTPSLEIYIRFLFF